MNYAASGSTTIATRSFTFVPVGPVITASPAALDDLNANLVRGDIAGGRNDPLQLVGRPRIAVDPYATGLPGVYLCSASTPPGAGVHGMSGHQAARRALHWLESTP